MSLPPHPRTRLREQIILEQYQTRLGLLECGPEHPNFHDLGPTSQYIVAFPTRAIRLTPPGRRTFQALPGTAVFMRRGERVLRTPISRDGDRCLWIGLDDATADVALASSQVDPTNSSTLPFGAFVSGTLLTDVRALAFDVAHHMLGADDAHDALLTIVDRALAHLVPSARRSRGERAAMADLVAHAAVEMSRSDPHARIEQIARRLGVEPYALSRAFRTIAQCSPSDFRRRLRLADSLEALAEGSSDLSRIAHDAGFASHSHYSLWFRRTFGMSPHAYRRRVHAPRSTRVRDSDFRTAHHSAQHAVPSIGH